MPCFLQRQTKQSTTNSLTSTLSFLHLIHLLPSLLFLSCFWTCEQASSDRRGEWEIQPSRQTNTSYLTSHLAADRHGGSVQVPSSHGPHSLVVRICVKCPEVSLNCSYNTGARKAVSQDTGPVLNVALTFCGVQAVVSNTAAVTASVKPFL